MPPTTPQDLAELLGSVVPGFSSHLKQRRSLFSDDNGTLTAHGLFAECSHFVRDHFDELPVSSVLDLANFISDCLDGAFGPALDNAAATCFLENLAGESFHAKFALLLRPKARSFYNDVIGV